MQTSVIQVFDKDGHSVVEFGGQLVHLLFNGPMVHCRICSVRIPAPVPDGDQSRVGFGESSGQQQIFAQLLFPFSILFAQSRVFLREIEGFTCIAANEFHGASFEFVQGRHHATLVNLSLKTIQRLTQSLTILQPIQGGPRGHIGLCVPASVKRRMRRSQPGGPFGIQMIQADISRHSGNGVIGAAIA